MDQKTGKASFWHLTSRSMSHLTSYLAGSSGGRAPVHHVNEIPVGAHVKIVQRI